LGIDVHKHYQPRLNFETAAAEDYDFTWLKIAEGPYPYHGTVLEIEGLKDYYKRIKKAGSLVGFYGFAVETDPDNADRSGRLQAEHFLERAEMLGGVMGKGVCIDFEQYDGYEPRRWPWLDPSNGTLKSYVGHLRDAIGDHRIIIYSGTGYWNSDVPSGPFTQYGADVAWSAAYPYDRIVGRPEAYYHTVRDWGWDPARRFGGVEHEFWQFTGAGTVAHQNIDVDAFRGSRERLLQIFDRKPFHPKPRPEPELAQTELAQTISLPKGTPRMPEGYCEGSLPYPGSSLT
jgi:GH25 family lysozyme M1 (1,4-beta-N-acetylmuramidase)